MKFLLAISLIMMGWLGTMDGKVRINAPHKTAMNTLVEPTHTRRVRADLIGNFLTPC